MTALPYLSVGDWDSEGVDTHGVEWSMTQLTGWFEPPGVKDSSSPRPTGPGSFDAPVYDDVRVLSWTERLSAPDQATLHAATVRFGSVVRSLNGGATITGHQADGDYTVTAKRAQGWQVGTVGNSPLAFEYQMSVTCVDPYKYGIASFTPPVSLQARGGSLVFPLWYPPATGGGLNFGAAGTGGQTSITNLGVLDAWPVFAGHGPLLGGFAVVNLDTGAVIEYSDDVPAGTTATLDSGSGRASLNGSDRTGSVTTREWWSIAPGDTANVQFRSLGSGQSGTLTITVRATYY